MSSTTDKIKGYADKTIGKAKEKVGNVTGSDRLQAEGVAQTIKGKAEVAVGQAKDQAKKVVDGL
jgi:uncharacterized protein YjbJ (UPF0337 family)